MTAEKTREDELLDLLYEELSPQEETEVRAAIEADEGLRDMWEELRADRAAVRAAMPEQLAVPQDVTAAILEGARTRKPGRRSPAGSGATKGQVSRGIWYDVTMGRYKAPVSVAVVLLCVGVVFTILRGEVEQSLGPAQEEVSAIPFGDGGSAGPKNSAAPTNVGQRAVPAPERSVAELDALAPIEEPSRTRQEVAAGSGPTVAAATGAGAPAEVEESVALRGGGGVQSRSEAPVATPERENVRRSAVRPRTRAPAPGEMERAPEPQVSQDSMEMLDLPEDVPLGRSSGRVGQAQSGGGAASRAPASLAPAPRGPADSGALAPAPMQSANVEMEPMEALADVALDQELVEDQVAEEVEQADEPEPTARERLEEAEEALAGGRIDHARGLLDGIETVELTEAEQLRLQDLREELSDK